MFTEALIAAVISDNPNPRQGTDIRQAEEESFTLLYSEPRKGTDHNSVERLRLTLFLLEEQQNGSLRVNLMLL